MRLHERKGATVVLMAAATSIVAAFAIQDPIKPEACSVIAALNSLGIMVSAAPCHLTPTSPRLPAFPLLRTKALCRPRDPQAARILSASVSAQTAQNSLAEAA